MKLFTDFLDELMHRQIGFMVDEPDCKAVKLLVDRCDGSCIVRFFKNGDAEIQEPGQPPRKVESFDELKSAVFDGELLRRR